MATDDLSRRAFLARIGVLGATATLLPQCAAPAAGTAASELGLGALVDLLRPVLAQLSRDTLNGFIAFTVPGRDDYSRAQGTPRAPPAGRGVHAAVLHRLPARGPPAPPAPRAPPARRPPRPRCRRARLPDRQ